MIHSHQTGHSSLQVNSSNSLRLGLLQFLPACLTAFSLPRRARASAPRPTVLGLGFHGLSGRAPVEPVDG